MTTSIERFFFAHAAGWVTWLPHAGPEQADAVAALAADDAKGQERVANAVREEDASIARLGSLSIAGLWVPDRAAARPRAFMYAGIVRDAVTTPALYAADLAAQKKPHGMRGLARSVEETTVPIGPAVVTVEVYSESFFGKAISSITWRIFADGYADAVEIVGRTGDKHDFEALAGELRGLAEELVLEPAPGQDPTAD